MCIDRNCIYGMTGTNRETSASRSVSGRAVRMSDAKGSSDNEHIPDNGPK